MLIKYKKRQTLFSFIFFSFSREKGMKKGGRQFPEAKITKIYHIRNAH